MRLAFFGDVVGQSGRNALSDHLGDIRKALKLDFCIVNAENAAGGFGLTEKVAAEIFAAGADVLTLGDHAWDQRDMVTYIAKDDRILRPLNYPARADAPGRGANVYTLPDGRRIGIVQLQGNVFMKMVMDNPFAAAEAALDSMPLGMVCDAIVVDMHCEASSEKMAMGHLCDGRASLVVGSHTHIPTGDAQILPRGTAYLTDAGMCGDYDSVIGMKKEISIERFLTQMPGERYQPADGPGTACGVFVETDDRTGLALKIAPIRVGGRLAQSLPES
jgi:metallophosphoesterase (TIGR00282 family)